MRARRLFLAIIAVVVAWAVAVTVWLQGCDENVDCHGVPLVAYYAVYVLIAAGVALVAAMAVGAIRRKR